MVRQSLTLEAKNALDGNKFIANCKIVKFGQGKLELSSDVWTMFYHNTI